MNDMNVATSLREFYNILAGSRWTGYDEVIEQTILTNRWVLDTTIYTINNEKVKIQKGQKFTKAVRMVADALKMNKDDIEKYCVGYSQVLNDKVITGELCVSIHPLDYITMSENASGWRSCMKWDQDGCYKQGTVEMMNSDNVVVVYLKSKEDMDVDGYTWNNKKWRCLYIVEDHFIYSVKPYPYENHKIMEAGAEFIAELLNAQSPEHSFLEAPQWVAGYETFETPQGRVCGFETDFMYNDIEESEDTRHVYIVDNAPTKFYDTVIDYSGPSQCMLCGNSCIENCEDLVCYHCDNDVYPKCGWCGDRYETDETFVAARTVYSTISICPHCAEEHFVYDEILGEFVEASEYNVYLTVREGHEEDFKDFLVNPDHPWQSPIINNEEFLKHVRIIRCHHLVASKYETQYSGSWGANILLPGHYSRGISFVKTDLIKDHPEIEESCINLRKRNCFGDEPLDEPADKTIHTEFYKGE